MSKIKLKDIIILLPGIQGSVLTKNGKELWKTSKAIGKVLNPFGSDFEELVLKNDDPFVDDIGDEVKATRLMDNFCIIPGFFKIDGYSTISKDLQALFSLTKGDPYQPEKPANYFEFAYDWRRTNRYSANRLKKLIDTVLPIWRKHPNGHEKAKVILIGHSMGGLVSRYYLEVLGGWEHCKSLITIATPHRGSVTAIDYLANGYKKLFLNFGDLLRSLPSAYELLPIYEMLGTPQGYKRITEVGGIPHVDMKRAKEGLEFHREIEKAIETNNNNIEYLKNKYEIIPLIGVNQTTFQSATFVDSKLKASTIHPPVVPSIMSDGDGTVPSVSAIPIELSDQYNGVFYSEKHASLQNNKYARKQLYEILKWMQNDLSVVRSNTKSTLSSKLEEEAQEKKELSLSLSLEDAYLDGERVAISGRLNGDATNGSAINLSLESLADDNMSTSFTTQAEEGEWQYEIPQLAPGPYRLKAECAGTSVQDVFIVSHLDTVG